MLQTSLQDQTDDRLLNNVTAMLSAKVTYNNNIQQSHTFTNLADHTKESYTTSSFILLKSFLADCTAKQYDWLWASSCRLAVCPSVCALWLPGSVYRDKNYTGVFLVPSRQVPICPFRHFCSRMYCLATICTGKKHDSKKMRMWASWYTDTMCALVYSALLTADNFRKSTLQTLLVTLDWTAGRAYECTFTRSTRNNWIAYQPFVGLK